MTRSFSIYLDALRLCAAFLVLMSHLAYPRFTEGRWIWIREINLGSDAVIIFFVLSGLVISHSAQNKLITARRYAFDRLTRLYSVAFPALIVGFALDNIGSFISPESYKGWHFNPLPFWEHLVRGLTFSNEWTGLYARLGTNGPYWSLSYEAAYYALFGIAIFTAGFRRVLLLSIGVLVAGLHVILLMPCWLFGVALQKLISQGRIPVGKTALIFAITPIVLYILALMTGLPNLLSQQYSSAIQILRFSDEFVWNTLLAMLVTVHLLGIAGLSNSDTVPFQRSVRWLAASSFSLYLMHYPALQFFSAVGFSGSTLVEDAALLGVTCILCLLFAAFFERPLERIRNFLRPCFFKNCRPKMTR